MSSMRAIAVRIYFLGPEEGGRSTPIFSGYRPALYFGEKQTDGAIILPSGTRVQPGTACDVVIKLLHPEHLGEALHPMAAFEAREGTRVIGRGKVLDPDPVTSNVS
jgi:elongation factor Tu